MNKYGVELSGPGGVSGTPKLSGPELLCQLKDKVEVATLTPDLQPFSLLPWATQLPPQQLTSDLGPYKSCAVVSSAGSLRYSGLGKEIGETFKCEFGAFHSQSLGFKNVPHIWTVQRMRRYFSVENLRAALLLPASAVSSTRNRNKS